ncbi:MAG TPA: sulfotransferase [Steroidobacteraceae bacterium]|nr:sulfotransferase [Steroidobacteraceae bacterium]
MLARAASLLDTDPAAAARLACEILDARPGHPAAKLLLGTARRSGGDAAAALGDVATLAARQPDSAVIQLELGRAALAAGDIDHARSALERAVALQPDLADAWRELSALHALRGEDHACDAAWARYAKLTAVDRHLAEAEAALGTGRLAVAEALLQRQLASQPQDVAALRMLAEIASRREEFGEAERLLKECLRLAPGYAQARFELAVALHSQQKPAPILPLVDRLLAQEPNSFAYRCLRASALTLLGQNEHAIEVLSGVLAEYPDHPKAWLNYGHVLRAAGRLEETIGAYRKSIELLPEEGEAYFDLANLKTFRFSDTELAAMRAQLAREDLRDEDRWHFEFALGKAEEDAGRYAESFAHYERGNALRRSNIYYDGEATAAAMRRTRDLMTAEFFAARDGWGHPSSDPIFIVGLPRSGSTLLEQILASHPAVEGTRELPDVPGFAYELGARPPRPGETAYPQSIATLSHEQLVAFGQRYLDQTRPHRLLGRAHFIDKMPNNFLNIGLIHLMLPRSRIIDARRHPMACCFSNFKQHFQMGLHFTYSLEEMARFYRDYVELMAHFDRILPGRVHRVHYEHLIEDPQTEVRRLLDYCGLPFDAACLRFHETKRVVQTASSEQVRRPLYADSVEQWRHYEPWLGPLQAALADLVAAYPAGSSAAAPVRASA